MVCLESPRWIHGDRRSGHAQLHTEVKVSLDYLKTQQQQNPKNKTNKATMPTMRGTM